MNVTGDKAIIDKLRTLPDKLAKKVMRRALMKAATPVINAAKKNAPKDTGALRKGITRKISVKGALVVKAEVGIKKGKVGRRRPVRYAHLAKPRKVWLFNALEQNKGQVMSILAAEIKAGIAKEVGGTGNTR